ncbi:hypothetical protein F6Y05_21430 [Bacillus megaterium]|nr:hypothetical protein [Priestia megaterium]
MIEDFNMDPDCEIGEDEYEQYLYGMQWLKSVSLPYEEALEKEKDFAMRLYKGFVAEYHLIAELFRIGLEGLKLPGDFGFDVMSTYQRKSLYEGALVNTVRFFQVKSRWIKETDYKYDQESKRVRIKFFITIKNMMKLVHNKEAYLVLYFMDEANGKVIRSFWLSNYHLDQLLAESYIKIEEINEKKYFAIDAEYILMGQKTKEIGEKLTSLFPQMEEKQQEQVSNLLELLNKVKDYDTNLIKIHRNINNDSIDLNAIHTDVSNINTSNSKTKIVDAIKILPGETGFKYPFDLKEILN